MAHAWVSIGSNIERRKNISLALQLLEEHYGSLDRSSVYESDAVGFNSAPFYNLVVGFQWIPIPILYIVVMGAICLHLYHGVRSFLQTLGLNHPRFNRYRRPLAVIVAAVVFVGFISVPVGVLAGVLTLN